jgi:hypothetical protein
VLERALDSGETPPASRSGAVRTRAVKKRTTLLLVRLRFHIGAYSPEGKTRLLAEEARLLAFEGAPREARWLEASEIEPLLSASPHGNIHPEQAAEHVRGILEAYAELTPHIEEDARERARALLEAHVKVRSSTLRGKSAKCEVEPQLPADVLGVWVYLPVPGGTVT